MFNFTNYETLKTHAGEMHVILRGPKPITCYKYEIHFAFYRMERILIDYMLA